MSSREKNAIHRCLSTRRAEPQPFIGLTDGLNFFGDYQLRVVQVGEVRAHRRLTGDRSDDVRVSVADQR